MAPFNTHFLVAEKIWPEFQNDAWGQHYGQFCFGCVAPDVDKASATLTQRDTHFFDRTTDYELMASARTAAFLTRQDEFLQQPFAELSSEAQAFVLGYLCHLAVDEVSKHLWRRETWLKFHHVRPTSAFAALDEMARQQIEDYAAIRRTLDDVETLDVLPHIPLTDLQRMLVGTRAFVAAPEVEQEYLALVDLFEPDRSLLDRRESLARLRREIDQARRQVHHFELERLARASIAHSRQRIADFLDGRNPEPEYPALERQVSNTEPLK